METETGIMERMGNLWDGFTPDGDMGEGCQREATWLVKVPTAIMKSWLGTVSGRIQAPPWVFLPLRRSADKPRAQFNLSSRVRFLEAQSGIEGRLNLEREKMCACSSTEPSWGQKIIYSS